jgi:VWFA-related protein
MRFWISLIAVTGSILPASAQLPTFSSRRESVRVDVLVTDRGVPVRDLKAGDFELFDAGVQRPIELATFEQLPISVVLALDASVSIAPDRLRHLRDGALAVLAGLHPEDQGALVTFADAVVVRQPLTTDAARVRAAVDQIGTPGTQPPGSGTALVDAAYTSMTLLNGDAGRGLLIAFTDGVDTSSWLRADRVLQAARRSNMVAYSVATSELGNLGFLRELSEVTGGAAIEIPSTDNLRQTFIRILDEFRQRYLLSFSPADAAGEGWRPLTVRVKRRNAVVKARTGYVR